MTQTTMIRACDIYDADVKMMDEDASIFLIKDSEGRQYVARPRGKMRDWEVLYEIK